MNSVPKQTCYQCLHDNAQFQDLQTQKLFCFQCYFGNFSKDNGNFGPAKMQKQGSELNGNTDSSSTYYNYNQGVIPQQQIQHYEEYGHEQPANAAAMEQDLLVGNLKTPCTPPKGYKAYQGAEYPGQGPMQVAPSADLLSYLEKDDLNLQDQPDIFKDIDQLIVGRDHQGQMRGQQIARPQVHPSVTPFQPALQGPVQGQNYYNNFNNMYYEGDDLAVQDTLTRQERVQRYLEKKRSRRFKKIIRYESRKKHAQIRPRIKGRFARRDEVEKLKRMLEVGSLKLQKPMKYFLPEQQWGNKQARAVAVPQTEEQWNDIFNNLCDADWENVLTQL